MPSSPEESVISTSDFQLQIVEYVKKRREALHSDSSFSSDYTTQTSLNKPRENRQRSISESIGKAASQISLSFQGNKCILTPELANSLRILMPPFSQLALKWNLVYSSERDGFSLRTMYAKCASKQHNDSSCSSSDFLLAIQAEGHSEPFGAFLTSRPAPHAHHYGSGEVFLWKMQNVPPQFASSTTESIAPGIQAFMATGKNEYWILSEIGYFAVGCSDGAFGLWLDESLRKGTSQATCTFDNEPLVQSKGHYFEVEMIELWSVE